MFVKGSHDPSTQAANVRSFPVVGLGPAPRSPSLAPISPGLLTSIRLGLLQFAIQSRAARRRRQRKDWATFSSPSLHVLACCVAATETQKTNSPSLLPFSSSLRSLPHLSRRPDSIRPQDPLVSQTPTVPYQHPAVSHPDIRSQPGTTTTLHHYRLHDSRSASSRPPH